MTMSTIHRYNEDYLSALRIELNTKIFPVSFQYIQHYLGEPIELTEKYSLQLTEILLGKLFNENDELNDIKIEQALELSKYVYINCPLEKEILREKATRGTAVLLNGGTAVLHFLFGKNYNEQIQNIIYPNDKQASISSIFKFSAIFLLLAIHLHNAKNKSHINEVFDTNIDTTSLLKYLLFSITLLLLLGFLKC